MTLSHLMSFLPELTILGGALVIFLISLGDHLAARAYRATVLTAAATLIASLLAFGETKMLFYDAYRVDAFSQLLKVVLSAGFLLLTLTGGGLPDIRREVKPEYYLLLTLSASGLLMLVSCVELITLVIALELASFPLYLLVPMRRERTGQRSQMESAVKYIMFGVAANGLMFFGLSYLFGLTGTLHLAELAPRLAPLLHSPLALAGLALTFCGIYYKLAVFPFHFWSPDVYQGSAHETAAAIASLPKVGAIAVFVRFVTLATPGHHAVVLMLAVLASFSMLSGNLLALAQRDFKRLLGFSAIAHAGYALVGFTAMDSAGYAAALYYITGYLVMVLACFAVIGQVSRDGVNVNVEDFAGLQKRSPLLATTLAVGVFGLAGLPPFAGFMGKLFLLQSALARGQLALVILAVVNTAIAIYYYLQVIREIYFREPAGDAPALRPDLATRVLCVVLIVITLWLGLVPGRLLEAIATSLR